MPVHEFQPQGPSTYVRPPPQESAGSSAAQGLAGREISLGVQNQAPSQDALPIDWAAWCKSMLSCARPVKTSDVANEQEFISTVSVAPSRIGMSAASRAREHIEALDHQIFNEGKVLIELLHSLHDNPTLQNYLDEQFREIGIQDGIGHFQRSGSLAAPNGAAQGNVLSWWDVGAGLQSTVGQVISSGSKVGAIAVATSVGGFLASYALGGLAAKGVQVLGAGLALGQTYTTITQLPQTVNQEAFKHRVNASMQTLRTLVESQAELKRQEERRVPLSDISNVVAQENQKHIEQLTAQKEQVQAELNQRGSNDPTMVLLLGSEGLGRKMLYAATQAKAAFVSLFSPIVRGLSSLSGLLTGLPDVIRRACARRQAYKQEQAFLVNYQSLLENLARPHSVRESLIEPLDIKQAIARASRYGSASDHTFKSVERQAYMGENLAHIIRNSSKPVYIDVQVNAHGAIPASLTLARALSWYLTMEAHIASSSTETDGAFTVDDPDGKLYGFLTSVPVAYSGTMAAVNDGRAPLGVLNIDDHGAGFPLGASGMQFEQDLNEHGELRLRMRFVQEPVAHVYAPLGNAGDTWKSLYSSTGHAATGVKHPGEMDFSETSNSALQRRQEQLGLQIAMKKQLKELSGGLVEQVQNWSQLPFMRQNLPQA